MEHYKYSYSLLKPKKCKPKKPTLSFDDKEKQMDKHDKFFTTSKMWLWITGLIFVIILVSVFVLMATSQDVFDTTIYVTAITVSGAIFGSNLCWYSKKSASENHYKLRMSMYEDVVNQRLYFNEEMIKMRQKYGVSLEEIQEIEDQSEMDEFMDEELNNVKNKLDEDREEAESSNELQSFEYLN